MSSATVIPITQARSRRRSCRTTAEVATAAGPRRAQVVGLVGDRAVVYWLEGRWQGQVGWPLQECVRTA